MQRLFSRLMPLTEVAVAEAIRSGRVREQGDDAVLRLAFGAGDFRHKNLLLTVIGGTEIFSDLLQFR